MSDLLDRMARAGFLARGAVYLCIGLLAAQAAAGTGGRATDASGAVRTMGRMEPHGIVVALLALGLLFYAAWRLAAGLLDIERKGHGAKALLARAGSVVSGLIHVSLALTAAGFGLRRGGAGGPQRWVAAVIEHPQGPWIVGAAGLAVLGGGVYQFYRAYATTFEEDIRGAAMSAAARRWYRRIGRFGTSARGVTFVVIGLALLRAASQTDPGEAKGLAAALRELHAGPHGDIVLGVVAFGLAAYGVMSLFEARYRRMGV